VVFELFDALPKKFYVNVFPGALRPDNIERPVIIAPLVTNGAVAVDLLLNQGLVPRSSELFLHVSLESLPLMVNCLVGDVCGCGLTLVEVFAKSLLVSEYRLLELFEVDEVKESVHDTRVDLLICLDLLGERGVEAFDLSVIIFTF